jgi:hypothetical protein
MWEDLSRGRHPELVSGSNTQFQRFLVYLPTLLFRCLDALSKNIFTQPVTKAKNITNSMV